MTHVILSNGFDEKHIAFPTLERFQDYLKQVRLIEPDRRWAILVHGTDRDRAGAETLPH